VHALERDLASWLDDTAGHPLGGIAPGRTLRQDGESHRVAWLRQIRSDPCSYCGGPGGTVDHIEPRAGPRVAGRFGWSNVAGACDRCNGSKDSDRLLVWLARRRVLVRGLRRV
jgi:5-methylcytosine-specific restriction endonuclease McrA